MSGQLQRALEWLRQAQAELEEFSKGISFALGLEDVKERTAAVRKVAKKHAAKAGTRRLSAAGRESIAKAARKRWRQYRAGKKAAGK